MRLKLVLLGFFAFYLAVSAQETVSPVRLKPGPVEHALSVNVDRVNVLFTVSGKGGKLVTHLTKDDFKVFEDGNPQDISNFSRESDLPLNIGLLVDTSGSVWGKLRFEREAATKFFYSNLRRGRDKAFVMAFDSRAVVLQDFTDNPATLQHAVEHMIAGGSTALFDAVAEAARQKLGRQYGKHVLIVLSDGLDNSSHTDLAGTLEAAQKNDVVIYTISTNRTEGLQPEAPARGDANLSRLAEETGGYALFPKRLEDLTEAFHRIGEDLRAQYSLAYGPTNSSRDGTYRMIDVVPSHKGYTVRCRHGYFAPGVHS
ncbi:MAG TPA: VWA domain-containing protein [Terriglobia bacterium]